MKPMGLLIDFEYCCGCHTCEVACQKEHGYNPGQSGVEVLQIGPKPIEGTNRYQFDYFPFFTRLCDFCAERTSKGKPPTCVKHCMTACLSFGEAETLRRGLESKKHQALFIP